jgi:hypothetical protein
LNVAPTFPVADWPVPKPVVVQPAAANAINEAPASRIEKAVIVLLLSMLKRRSRPAAPLADEVHLLVTALSAEVHAAACVFDCVQP